MMRHRQSRILGGGLLALALTLGTAACGSDSEGGDPTAAGSAAGTADTDTAAGATSAPSTGGADSSAGADDETSAATCVKDSDYLSGTSTVVWTPDSKSEHQVAEVAADHKFALTAGGKLDPATIEVGVNEVFSVTLAQDADGISVLKIGCDGGQTMSKGTEAGIYITAPGTYAVTSGIEDAPAGTIEVE